jgi:hypothetical protein
MFHRPRNHGRVTTTGPLTTSPSLHVFCTRGIIYSFSTFREWREAMSKFDNARTSWDT